MKNGNKLLALILALLLIAALTACGKPAAEPVAEPAAEPEAGQTETAAPADAVTNEGLVLPIPEQYKDLLEVKTFENNEQGYLFYVAEKASIEAGKKQGHDESWGDGWICSIGRVSEEFAKEMRCGDSSGAQLFAKAADGTRYVLYYATDVRLVREDYSNIPEADMQQWSDLNDWAWSRLQDDFCKENGLEKEVFGNTDIDIVFARIAFQNNVNYKISTTEFGPLEPKDVDPAPYLDKLMNGVAYAYTEGEAPDGEYVVLQLPDEGVRYDFFRADETLIRIVYDGGVEVLFRATFADGKTTSTAVMQEWYDALAAAR